MNEMELKTINESEVFARVVQTSKFSILALLEKDVRPIYLSHGQALKLAHFILENVK